RATAGSFLVGSSVRCPCAGTLSASAAKSTKPAERSRYFMASSGETMRWTDSRISYRRRRAEPHLGTLALWHGLPTVPPDAERALWHGLPTVPPGADRRS